MRIIDLAYQHIGAMDKEQLWATLRWPKALVVHESAPALEVADIVDLNGMSLVVVLDQNNEIRGIQTLATVIEWSMQHLHPHINVMTMSSAVSEITRSNTSRNSLNTKRPELYWCERGKHLTSENPCSEHKK
jgi:signal-transduction protein with cAMP-binding, CBS, and nucleotidyltransferase domain